MRITDLIIENFGPHLEWRPDRPIADGLTVFHGANEKGKSAVRAFIRMVLFGKMRANATEARRFNYIHATPASGAGSISVRVAESNYVLRRVEGSAPSVTGDGTGGQDFLNGLIGGIDSTLYEKVFSISLTELESIDSLNSDEVRDRIYSAGLGLGNVSLPAAMKRLDDERAQPGGLYSPQRGRLRENLSALAEERRALREAAASNAEYETLGEQIAEVEEAATNLETALRGAREREQHFRFVNTLRNPVIRKLDLERQLREAPTVAAFPTNGLDRLLKLHEQIKSARDELRAVNGRLSTTRAELDELQVIGAFNVHDSDIRRLLSRVKSYEDVVRDLPSVEAEAAEERLSIDAGLPSLGPNWDDTVLASFVNGEAVAANLKSLGGKLETARQNAKLSGLDLVLAQQKLSEARQTGAEHDRALKRLDATVSESVEQLRRRERRADRLQRTLADQRDSVASDANSRPVDSYRHINHFLPSGIVAILGTGLAMVLFFISNVPGAIGVVAFSLLAAYALLRATGDSSAGEASMNESLISLRDEISEIAGELGISQPVTERAVLELQSSIREATVVAEKRDAAQALLEESAARYEQLEREARSAEETAERDSALADEIENQWTDSLHEHNLPAESDTTTAVAAVERANLFQNKLANLDKLRGRIGVMRQATDEVEESLVPILTEAGMEGFMPLAAGPALAELSNKFHANEQRATAAEELRRKIAEADAQRMSRTTQLRELELEERNLLTAAGVNDQEQFRSLAERIKKRRETERDLQQLASDHAELVDPRSSAVLEVIADTTREEIEARRGAADDEINRLVTEQKEAQNNLGGLQEQRINLEKANPAIELQEEIGRLEGQVENDARRWAVLTIAEKAITETRDRYQSERQAPLMLTASQHFKTFTNGAYTKVEAVLGEDVIQVVEATGGTKNIDALSRGTAEQLYLAMRFALIEEYGQHRERMPVLMDDVMVNFDPDRTRVACDAIVEFSQRHQVLLLTCHPQTVDMLEDAATKGGFSAPSVIEL